jgi:hypothetical protein
VGCWTPLAIPIGRLEGEIAGLATPDPRVQARMALPGIGRLTAMTLVAEIGDISRFPTARKLCAWAGRAAAQAPGAATRAPRRRASPRVEGGRQLGHALRGHPKIRRGPFDGHHQRGAGFGRSAGPVRLGTVVGAIRDAQQQ